MSRIIALCGKLCSGKSTYARSLSRETGGVVLSCDELMTALFHHQEGEKHDRYVSDVKEYLHKKAEEIARVGVTVILDWGFWLAEERRRLEERCQEAGISLEWRYMAISDEDWQINIARRNEQIQQGLSQDYYVDEGLLRKMNGLFQPLEPGEMDRIIPFERR